MIESAARVGSTPIGDYYNYTAVDDRWGKVVFGIHIIVKEKMPCVKLKRTYDAQKYSLEHNITIQTYWDYQQNESNLSFKARRT